ESRQRWLLSNWLVDKAYSTYVNQSNSSANIHGARLSTDCLVKRRASRNIESAILQLAASDLGMIEKVVQKPSVNFSFTLSHLYADSIVPFANWSLGEGFRQLPNASTLHRSIQQAFVSSQNLSVATKIYPPFVMYRTEDNDGNPLSGNDRWYGHSIELFRRIAELSGLKYTIHHVFDNHFGSIVNSSGNIEQWNGLVYELMNNMADVAVGPITVTYERER
uniref:Lig_chan-Glu_bd domain-containing protein n=1 Tax=Macrostomum lignano TaxID=282301 RepID=A0A1I8GR54_9PLAT